MPTHYEVLAVAKTADQAEIRRAYHRAARRWHPDSFVAQRPSEAARAETEMRLVNQAWTVLRDKGRRDVYDRELAGVESVTAGSGIRSEDGVIRIDPRLLDPEFIEARRHAQSDEISNRSSAILRVAPMVALLGLLVGIFIFTAYARGDGAISGPTTVPGPNLGKGIGANVCVSVLTGPALMARPCDAAADGVVIGSRQPDGTCPVATIREVELGNGAIACLGAIR